MVDIKFNGSFLVTLHNDLVQARFHNTLSINEQKILFSVLSNIEPPETEIIDGKRVIKERVKGIEPFRVPIKEFTEFLGIKDPNYAYFKSTVVKLMQKLIEIQQADGSWKLFQWVTGAEYIAKEGIAKIKISPELYPYLLNLEGNFTKTKLDVLLSFKSTYSSRLYQLVRKWSNLGKWKIELDELKHLIGVPIVSDNKGVKEFRLAKYNHFKKRALEVALNEINEHSELNVSITEHKTVRKITAITFHIKTKNGKKDEGSEPNKDKQEDDNTIYGKRFLEQYEYNEMQRMYVDRKNKEIALFDGENRIKAILLKEKFNDINDESLFIMEDILIKIIDVQDFNVAREVAYIFNYAKTEEGINSPDAFIISTLIKLSKEVLKGNHAVKVKDVINVRRDKVDEILPDWWFSYAESKMFLEEKEKIKENLLKLDGYNLTITDVTNIQMIIMLKNVDSEDQIDVNMRDKYNLYIELKESGLLDQLVEKKEKELKDLGYLDKENNISDDVIKELYKQNKSVLV